MWQEVSLVSPLSDEFESRQQNGLAEQPPGIRKAFVSALEKMQEYTLEDGMDMDIDFKFTRGSNFECTPVESGVSFAVPLSHRIGSPSPDTSEELHSDFAPIVTSLGPQQSRSSWSSSSSMSSSSAPHSTHINNEDSASNVPSSGLSVGDVVFVTSRTWPGIVAYS
mmetsp:Transcript_11754/g.21820  ORF Transcript_11754/g.21820 Transcript_11754/m.21820 type:complete len:166 (+) Transcript_11754:525-1022(+)